MSQPTEETVTGVPQEVTVTVTTNPDAEAAEAEYRGTLDRQLLVVRNALTNLVKVVDRARAAVDSDLDANGESYLAVVLWTQTKILQTVGLLQLPELSRTAAKADTAHQAAKGAGTP